VILAPAGAEGMAALADRGANMMLLDVDAHDAEYSGVD
jgi:hypothetical protein